MRSIPTVLASHIAGEVATLATCWRIKRRDGIVLGFTTHDRPFRIDGVIYRAAGGFNPSTMESSNALDVDNLDIEGILADAALSRADLLAGRYDLAEVEIFMVNWAAPDDGAVMLKTGLLGDASLKDADFTVEVRGMAQLLQTDVGEIYSHGGYVRVGEGRWRAGAPYGERLGARRVGGNVIGYRWPTGGGRSPGGYCRCRRGQYTRQRSPCGDQRPAGSVPQSWIDFNLNKKQLKGVVARSFP